MSESLLQPPHEHIPLDAGHDAQKLCALARRQETARDSASGGGRDAAAGDAAGR